MTACLKEEFLVTLCVLWLQQQVSFAGNFSCNFDDGRFCDGSMTQVVSHSGYWDLHTGSTLTMYTGPDFDHTLGEGGGGYYIFYRASQLGENFEGREAVVYTPVFGTGSTSHCFSFAYHMYGKHVGVLRVFGKTSLGPETQLFWKMGNQGQEWKVVRKTISAFVIQVRFSAIHGGGVAGDIAVDDVQIYTGSCKQSQMTESSVSTPTTITPETTSTATTVSKTATSAESTTTQTTQQVQDLSTMLSENTSYTDVLNTTSDPVVADNDDPCLISSYLVLEDQTWRKVTNPRQSEVPRCDNNLSENWYRFYDEPFDHVIATLPVETALCGTSFPVWVNGTLPTSENKGIEEVMACMSTPVDICEESWNIDVKWCGYFYVYRLQPTPRCDAAYCVSGVVASACDSDPCAAGASCVDNDSGYQCICPPLLTGSRCESKISGCSSSPCYDNSKCQVKADGQISCGLDLSKWNLYKGYEYLITLDKPVLRQNSISHCTSAGGNLAKINEADIQGFLLSGLPSIAELTKTNSKSLWIGLELNPAEEWMWLYDNTTLQDWNFWGDGYPMSGFSDGNPYRFALLSANGDDFQWITPPSEMLRHGYICMRDFDECFINSPCDDNEVCFNNDGGYECQCLEGFSGPACNISSTASVSSDPAVSPANNDTQQIPLEFKDAAASTLSPGLLTVLTLLLGYVGVSM